MMNMPMTDSERMARAAIATVKKSHRPGVSKDGPREFLIQTAQRVIEQLIVALQGVLIGEIESLAHFYLGEQMIELGFLQYENVEQVRSAIHKAGIDSLPLFRDGVKEIIEAAEIDGNMYVSRNMFTSDKELLWTLGSVSLVVVYQSEYLAATSGDETSIEYLKDFATRFFYAGHFTPYVYSKLGENYLALGQPFEAREWYDNVVSTNGLKYRMPRVEPNDGRPPYQLIIDHAETRIAETRNHRWDLQNYSRWNPWGSQKPKNKRWRLF